MREWENIVKHSKNPNVLLMLSGGKDSIATLITLIRNDISVTAIHFLHSWCEVIPSEEAERICKKYNVKLVKVDFSAQFYNAIKGYADGRPCLLCKKQMYLYLEKFLKNNKFGWLAIGDNANDTTTIARMNSVKNPFGDNLICSDYFGTEMGIALPKGMHILRPLIQHSANQIEKMLAEEDENVRRINSTGDKYFEYHREGCPVQFIDNGYSIDYEILDKLKKYNSVITEYARSIGIRASIHMPSTFIATIPKGYELDAAKYLEKRGLRVDHKVNFCQSNKIIHIYSYIEIVGTDIIKNKSYKKLFHRLIERLLINNCKIDFSDDKLSVYCTAKKTDLLINLIIDKTNMVINITVNYTQDSSINIDIEYFKNLLVELFRTRRIDVYRKGLDD